MKRRQILILVFAVAIICMILVLVSNNSGDPIHYKTVDGIDTITICDVNNSNTCITSCTSQGYDYEYLNICRI